MHIFRHFKCEHIYPNWKDKTRFLSGMSTDQSETSKQSPRPERISAIRPGLEQSSAQSERDKSRSSMQMNTDRSDLVKQATPRPSRTPFVKPTYVKPSDEAKKKDKKKCYFCYYF
jgi:hypothetical protein